MPIQRSPIDSSHLAEVGHDAESRTLEIAFRDGQVYQYSGVPANIYQAMLAAKSAGRYFNANIKTKYQSVRLTPPPKPKPKSAEL